jgi:DNA-binding LytR/AlgR family response regulator
MNRKLRTIVVEDERLPRLTLLKKLEALAADVEVVAACDSYEKARDSIRALKPDLLLMDIQLQGRDSISLLDELKEDMTLPHVIFTTAYDDRSYLMSAIKLQATDYLLKPVSPDELSQAIGKVKRDTQHPTLNTQHSTPNTQHPTLAFRTSAGREWVAADSIAYVKAARNYAVLVCFDHEELLLDNLHTIEAMLDPQQFVRVDRSTIINRRAVTHLNTRSSVCKLRSADGTEIELELTKVALDHLKHM